MNKDANGLSDLISNKKGTLTKVSIDSKSNVPEGTELKGTLKVIEVGDKYAVICQNSNGDYVQTSAIQDWNMNNNVIFFKTMTSVYNITLKE
jgi:hypothetical protein